MFCIAILTLHHCIGHWQIEQVGLLAHFGQQLLHIRLAPLGGEVAGEGTT
ncbi:MAG: hypothetical protein ACYC9P_09840 [Rudaea sp.]